MGFNPFGLNRVNPWGFVRLLTVVALVRIRCVLAVFQREQCRLVPLPHHALFVMVHDLLVIVAVHVRVVVIVDSLLDVTLLNGRLHCGTSAS